MPSPETPSTPLLEGVQKILVEGQLRSVHNARGDPIHDTLEGVRNFWRWFAPSKSPQKELLDEQGRPQVFYHGTSEKKVFEAFRLSPRGSFGQGLYLAESPDIAAEFGDERIESLYANWQRPFYVRADYDQGASYDLDVPWIALVQKLFERGEAQKIISSAQKGEKEKEDGFLGKEVRDRLLSWGHDAIVAVYPDGSREFVALQPHQVKSTDNSGTFDPESDSLRDVVKASLDDTDQVVPRQPKRKQGDQPGF